MIGIILLLLNQRSGQGAKVGLDYDKFYLSYMSFSKATTVIHAPEGGSSVSVDLSFLCLAGSLLGMSKHMVMFKDKLADIDSAGVFSKAAELDFQAARNKDPTKQVSKTQILAQMCLHFGRFSAAATSLLNMTQKLADDDKEKIYFHLLMKKMSGFAAHVLRVCSDELGCAWGFLDEKLKEVYTFHDVKTIFESKSEKLDKSLIGALAKDPKTQLLLLVGTRAGTMCTEIKAALDATRLLPSDLVLSKSTLNLIAAVQNDFNSFSSSTHQGAPKEGNKSTLANFTFFQGSLTLAQCLSRDLNPGETRVGLVKRCLELLDSKGMKFDDSLKRRVDALKAGR